MEVINTIGRRKTSIARIYVQKGKGSITINGKDYKKYFSTAILQAKVAQPLTVTNQKDKFDVDVHVEGGGINGQAEAVRLAVARALVQIDGEVKKTLRMDNMMTRDPRMVERKKSGQKKARKRFQFSKR